MRGLYFGGRVTRELLRDPLSYIFCLLTPMGMQLMFFIIWSNVPEAGRANMEIFRADTLAPGIAEAFIEFAKREGFSFFR